MYIFFVYFQSSFFIFILFIIYKILIAPVFRTKYPFRKAEKGQEKKVSWNDGHATVSQYWKLLVTLPLELPVACALAGFFFFLGFGVWTPETIRALLFCILYMEMCFILFEIVL